MGVVHGRAVAYGHASRAYEKAQTKVAELRSDLNLAEEVMRKAEMERNRTQRELLEEAKLT